MARGMASATFMWKASTASSSFLNTHYPWQWVDGASDDVYGFFRGTMQHIDTSVPIVLRLLCRTLAAPAGQIGNMALQTKRLRVGSLVSVTTELNFVDFDFSANGNPGLIDTEYRWIHLYEYEAGFFQPGDRVHVRLRRTGGAASDTLNTNLIAADNAIELFYATTREGAVG